MIRVISPSKVIVKSDSGALGLWAGGPGQLRNKIQFATNDPLKPDS